MSVTFESASDMPAALITCLGTKEAIEGSIDLGGGNLLQGAKKVFVGLSGTNLGARAMGLGDGMHQEMMKYSLSAGPGYVAVKGLSKLFNGVQQKSTFQVVKGAAQTAVGVAGVVALDALDSKVILVAHQASLLSLISGLIAKSGFSDFRKANYRDGAEKMLLGIGGLACAGYYVYSEIFNDPTLIPDTLTEEDTAFLTAHRHEIDKLNLNKRPTGSWKKLGKGVSKTAYIHPDMPKSLLKIEHSKYSFWNPEDSDIERSKRNLQFTKQMAEKLNLDSIAFPKSVLIDSGRPYIFEERFDIEKYSSVPDSHGKLKAEEQLRTLASASGLCDVDLKGNHNAGFIKGTERIGLFDFDCSNHPQINLEPLRELQKITGRYIGVGGAMLASAARYTREVAGETAAKALIITGVAAVSASYIAVNNYSPQGLPENIKIGITGAAAAATAVLGGVAAVATNYFRQSFR